MSNKIKVEFELDDLMSCYSGDSVTEVIRGELNTEILKLVKRDPRYKLFIQQQAVDYVDKLVAKKPQ